MPRIQSSAMKIIKNFFTLLLVLSSSLVSAQSWTADNGDGTFTNPLFFEEFSDPSMVRVGDDYYMTGTTMHCMPGLPVLHSKDMVNWRLISYAFDRFNLGPEFSFQNGRDMYGQGIWAPSLFYHKGTFYIFANINGHTTQIYQSRDPRGPWKHSSMKCSLHDLSVLFDDDGKIYVTWGSLNKGNRIALLNEELTDTIPGTTHLIGYKIGEGSHMYKIDGKYFITFAVPGSTTPMLCGRSDEPFGPYKIIPISKDDHMGVGRGHGWKSTPRQNKPFELVPQRPDIGYTLHQGGIIQIQSGEWWGYSMQDHNAMGRLTCLAPVTWHEGYPYFGLPGNLTKSPRTWLKPNTGQPQQPIVSMIDRNDDFEHDSLGFQWQWSHLPDDSQWSLTERKGWLRFHTLPAPSFWTARNTLTQRAIGPQSICTVTLDGSNLKEGDVAGLAVLLYPYAWIGMEKVTNGYQVKFFDYTHNNPYEKSDIPTASVKQSKIYLRVSADFHTEKAQFSYSTNGKTFHPLGEPFTMVFTMTTFQGARYALFSFNQEGKKGGYADFDRFRVDEPHPKGFYRPIPYKKNVSLKNKADNSLLNIGGTSQFKVVQCGPGRVALRQSKGNQYVSVDQNGQVSLKEGNPTLQETFQWIELEQGDLVLLSLSTNRYLKAAPGKTIEALTDVPSPARNDGVSFIWNLAK